LPLTVIAVDKNLFSSLTLYFLTPIIVCSYCSSFFLARFEQKIRALQLTQMTMEMQSTGITIPWLAVLVTLLELVSPQPPLMRPAVPQLELVSLCPLLLRLESSLPSL
jgi:hypothetical protein